VIQFNTNEFFLFWNFDIYPLSISLAASHTDLLITPFIKNEKGKALSQIIPFFFINGLKL
jgi:hypothetical protein